MDQLEVSSNDEDASLFSSSSDIDDTSSVVCYSKSSPKLCITIDSSDDTDQHDDDDNPEDTSNQQTQQDNQLAQQQAPTRNPIRVQRAEISAADVRDAELDLDGLDVEAYDQQSYERQVFDQVDRAISTKTKDGESQPDQCKRKAQDDQQKDGDQVNIGDLMQLIHDRTDQTTGQDEDFELRDEQVLQLTRQVRLERQQLEIQKQKQTSAQQSDSNRSLPKIPRLSISLKRSENGDALSTSSVVIKTEPQDKSTDILLTSSGRRRVANYCEQSDSEDEDISSAIRQKTSNYEVDNGKQKDLSRRDKPNNDVQDYEVDEDEQTNSDDLEYESDEHQPVDEADSQSEEQKEHNEDSSRHKKMKDDGDFKSYEKRMKLYNRKRAKARLNNILEDGTEFKVLEEMVTIEGNLKLPKQMWDALFEHQKTGVKWLWELHQLGAGGILGDEMGLGKTIQMIAFLTALRCSDIITPHMRYEDLGPTVLVCPATVMHQWLAELRKWYPPFRVAILHSTGSFSGDKKNLVYAINKSRGILIVSFAGTVIYQDYLHALDWHYAILDEGHKIRNPDAQVTLACKRFRTPHRIILSGSPVQNNLKELWSIFDFIFPGKLGTLPVFMEQFATPITQGGYANASDIQVQIAYKCACVLRDTIKPFLLRRTKAEVNSKLKLPERSEQVLFCKLTEKQRQQYQSYLDGPVIRDIKRGFCQIFVGLIELRKICNHPDLFDANECKKKRTKAHDVVRANLTEFLSVDETYGHFKKCGKMMVVDALLKLWKQQDHKVLLFTQSRQMLKIFKIYMTERDYKYMEMDGTTPIGLRQSMIEEFNTNQDIFIFLLTTRVGGVGVNLTGANRIIIYDPDWNPSTDIQARERAWRIGQQRHVIIYRLLTAGTIEEKIYHRQVFKLYLTNRILKDAKQKRFFKTNDLHELFRLGDDQKNIETKALFDDDLQIDPNEIRKSRHKKEKKSKKHKKHKSTSKHGENLENKAKSMLSESKLQEMREQAKRLSQMIGLQYGSKQSEVEHHQEAHIKEELPDCPLVETRPVHCDLISVKRESDFEPTSELASDLKSIPYVPCAPSREVNGNDKNNSKERKSKKLSNKSRCDYLVKQDIYKPETSADSDKRYQRDDYILERLFKNSNIFGALKHDKIESDSTSDFKVVESEAEKVARDAIRALRESRRMCMGPSAGVPNWTGRNGQMNSRPTLQPRNRSRLAQPTNVTSSSSSTSAPGASREPSLLDSIRQRNKSNPVPVSITLPGHRPIQADSDEEEELDRDFRGQAKEVGADDMASKIRNFLMYKSTLTGEAPTEELLEFFKQTFKPDKTAVFKALLYKMCEFHRRIEKGFWRLKTEFRDL